MDVGGIPWEQVKIVVFFRLEKKPDRAIGLLFIGDDSARKGSVPSSHPYNAPYTSQFMRRNILNTNIYVYVLHYVCNFVRLYNFGGHYIRVNILNAVHLHCKYGYFVRITSQNRIAGERGKKTKTMDKSYEKSRWERLRNLYFAFSYMYIFLKFLIKRIFLEHLKLRWKIENIV